MQTNLAAWNSSLWLKKDANTFKKYYLKNLFCFWNSCIFIFTLVRLGSLWKFQNDFFTFPHKLSIKRYPVDVKTHCYLFCRTYGPVTANNDNCITLICHYTCNFKRHLLKTSKTSPKCQFFKVFYFASNPSFVTLGSYNQILMHQYIFTPPAGWFSFEIASKDKFHKISSARDLDSNIFSVWIICTVIKSNLNPDLVDCQT